MRRFTCLIVVLAITLIAVGCDKTPSTKSADNELQQTEDNQQRLASETPPPQFKVSQERKNLARKLSRWNVE
ncbi:MAG: hypothetical protein V3S01_01170, partial [Dehalococcoidia bacterium]